MLLEVIKETEFHFLVGTVIEIPIHFQEESGLITL